MTHHLTKDEARQIAVRAQLLDANRPKHLLDLVRGLTLLQLDPTSAVAPSAHLVAWSRLGSGYSPADLEEAVDQRSLIELRGMVRPAEDIPLYRAEMADWPGPPGGWRHHRAAWVQANDECRRDILARLDADGPLLSRDLPDTCTVPWKSSGWTNNRNVTQMLEIMLQAGEIAVAGRHGGERLWDLAERVYPDTPIPDANEAKRQRDERRLASLGIARGRAAECPVEPQDVGEAGEPAVIEGVKGVWRVDPAQLGRPFEGRVALLSPFDRLIYDRKRMVELFGFDYQLEMYKPVAKRRWGYYALPILAGDRLVGKVDAVADRRSGVLRVHAVHEDTAHDHEAVLRELVSLATWLRLEPPEEILSAK
ncbi:crosslink repair DNA glycosylase YcaQ family protein [Dactylosporangium sp. AC04546]|uniref:DNA glycosylase AlkZ-like family protein n=1 Tax=Dactylosporangium sp. AC04546 TaxID=2862460 RepID=UPI001EE03DF2|nr:crosslink repair DNA glycosylase YcaQ family protein [Dactylosporangium sp. AC04546]WVK89190.1 crosslink repair DNA glycosylase YcaQ family protein [Dactylosporangium sp. AC04546]